MKVALSSKSEELNSPLDERFGRAKQFLIYDLDKDSYTSISNTQNLNAPQGAGIQSAQNIINAGADALITGNVGPNAFKTLQAADIDIYLTSNISLADAIAKFKAGTLTKADSNNVEGHWI